MPTINLPGCGLEYCELWPVCTAGREAKGEEAVVWGHRTTCVKGSGHCGVSIRSTFTHRNRGDAFNCIRVPSLSSDRTCGALISKRRVAGGCAEATGRSHAAAPPEDTRLFVAAFCPVSPDGDTTFFQTPCDARRHGNSFALAPLPAASGCMVVKPAASTNAEKEKSFGIQMLSVQPDTKPKGCAGCNRKIKDRYLLKALDKYWHEDCLKCACCDCRLGEVGSTLYTKANLILCRRDYLRLFGVTGNCAACSKLIPAFEMVMRAKENVYHLDCFACQLCNQRFCVGDKFFLKNNMILCQTDYEEGLMKEGY
ncbi:LIM domain only protein 3 isoform X1, partial [Lates japonicus]